ncbi:NAD(P)/FAD-dependent oxidoreductase [Halomonas halocynthiae]|uniref:NAD(P)/FAD-dependent oxidoreductase n=1 Tax=Halomonas halocynthiae TaxID=176290 RepID=UPI00041D1D99|nr:FAD-dependent oxidoreductase [Halomonas halocynthiae]
MSAPVTIIGSGMAGFGLARQLRSRDPQRSVTLLTADGGDDYSKPLLSTGFAKRLSPERLVARSALQVAQELDITLRTHTVVDAIDTGSCCLQLGAESLPYSQLVLATGAAPRQPFMVPDELAGRVMAVNNLDDYRRFHAALAALQRPADVVVVGTGLVGCEFADDLVAGGHRVSMVAPEETLLARLLPAELGQALGDAFIKAGIRLYCGTTVQALYDAQNTVAVQLSHNSVLHADFVLVATGLRPAMELANAAGINVTQDGIVVDRYLETSVSGIYALGDVACVDGVNAMYVQPLQAGAKALAATLSGSPTPVSYGAWPIMVKTSLLPIVSLPPAISAVRWRIEGSGRDLAAFAESEDGQLQGFALTGDGVRRKVRLARLAPPLLG